MKWLFFTSILLFIIGSTLFVSTFITSKKDSSGNRNEFMLRISKKGENAYSLLIGTYNHGVGATGFGLSANDFSTMFKKYFDSTVMVPIYIDEFWDMTTASNGIEAFEAKLKEKNISFISGIPTMVPIISTETDKAIPIELLMNTHYSLFCFCSKMPSGQDRIELMKNCYKSPWDSTLFVPASLIEYHGHGGPLAITDSECILTALSFLFPTIGDPISTLKIDFKSHEARYKIARTNSHTRIEQNDFKNKKRLVVTTNDENQVISRKLLNISIFEKSFWYYSNRIQGWSVIIIALSIIIGIISVIIMTVGFILRFFKR